MMEDKKAGDEASAATMRENPTMHTSNAVWETRQTYCQPGFRGLATSYHVALCAAFSALGGLVFGIDQGIISVILVESQFLEVFPQINEGGFWKGLLTAMIELGALIGALNQGWIADKYSRKYSIVIAVCVFVVGSVLQTAAVAYSMLVVARFIGGLGIGMLSMVAPLYISEISPPEIRGALLVLEEFSIVTGIVSTTTQTFHSCAEAGTGHCILDHIWHTVHTVAVGLEVALLAPDHSGSGPRSRHLVPTFQSTVAGLQRA